MTRPATRRGSPASSPGSTRSASTRTSAICSRSGNRFGKAWERRVREHFDFLVEHGFRFDNVEANWWATTAVYLSPALGLEVTRSVEFNRVEITLLRLVGRELPEYEVWVADRPLNRVLFDNVLIARAPDVDEASRTLTGVSSKEVERQLRFWADALRSVAPDFLDGDDAPLREGEQVVRQRVEENPQELTIWLPSDASQKDEDRARERARQTAPPNVEVSVRRYRR
jgi:hypothetical protein